MAQMLTSAYACPQATTPQDAAAIADCMSTMHSGMDPEQPLLCKAHCDAGEQSVNAQAGALDTPPAAAVCNALAGVLPIAEAAERAAVMPSALAHGPPAGTPPLYLALLVLRN